MKEKSWRKKRTHIFVSMEQEEKSSSTRKQYLRDIRSFCLFLGKESCTKEKVLEYKERLQEYCQPSGVNTKLAALNGIFAFIGKNEYRVKLLKIQRRIYCPQEKELTKEEYLRLVKTAKKDKQERMSTAAADHLRNGHSRV